MHPNTTAQQQQQQQRYPQVELLVELLTLLVERQGLARVFLNEIGVDPSTTHLLWIDADAAVLRQHVSVAEARRSSAVIQFSTRAARMQRDPHGVTYL